MIYCNKATSVLFPKIDKVIQVYTCRISHLYPYSFGVGYKSRKTQKNIQCKDNSVGSTLTKAESACTETNEVKTNDGLNESCPNTICSEDATYKTATDTDNFNEQIESTKKIYRPKTNNQTCWRNTGVQSKKEKKISVKTKAECCTTKMSSKLVNANQKTFNKTSLISLYHKRKICKPNKDRPCKCNFSESPKKSVNGKDNPKDKNVVRKSSMIKIKEKVSDVFRKYSKKIKLSNDWKGTVNANKIRKENICIDAYNQGKQDICYAYELKVDKCTDKTCTPCKNRSKIMSPVSQTLSQKLHNRLKSINKYSARDHMKGSVVVQNEKEQTGDPLFEIKVNDVDMCVLNSSEIKNKVMCLGREKKREKCVCPSHAVKRQYILEKEACLNGACRKALKHKQTNFTCKCLKNKVWTCSDSTCEQAVPLKNNVNCLCVDDSPKNDNKPLFEVHVDSGNMCIINTNEMRSKLEDIKRRNNKLCRSGICKKKCKERNTRVVCTCKKPMKYDECEEDTCKIPQKCCTCGKPHNKKTLRGNLDTASLKNITSRVSGFCARMFCRSDNLTNRQKKRRKRKCRRCNNSVPRTQSENVHKRNGLKIMIKEHNIPQNNHESDNNCCPCDSGNGKQGIKVKKTKGSMGDTIKPLEETNTKSKNASSPKPRVRKPKHTGEKVLQSEKVAKRNVHHRSGLVVPVPSSKLAKKSSKIVKKKIQAICQCHHICECDLVQQKRKMKEREKKKRGNYNQRRAEIEKKKRQKKSKSASEDRQWQKESLEKRKEFAKARNKAMKEEQKRRKKRLKEEMEVMKLLESKDGARRTNCCVEIFGAILSAGFHAVKLIFYALYKVISDPKGSYWYTRERMQYPEGTYASIKRVMGDGLRIRKLKITKCLNNSETVGILSDTFKESPVYQLFADKGKTKKEQEAFEVESKKRKRRVRKRQDAAIYGCRHVLLTTLRKTPCLWVYHVCPEFYPQCLSCLAFMRNFWHMCLFVLAFACWTPCIVFCEALRGLCCCLLCTG